MTGDANTKPKQINTANVGTIPRHRPWTRSRSEWPAQRQAQGRAQHLQTTHASRASGEKKKKEKKRKERKGKERKDECSAKNACVGKKKKTGGNKKGCQNNTFVCLFVACPRKDCFACRVSTPEQKQNNKQTKHKGSPDLLSLHFLLSCSLACSLLSL